MIAGRWDEALRQRLAELADTLIPAGEGRPSASEVGVSGALLDHSANLVPERLDLLETVVVAATAATNVDSETFLSALQQKDPKQFDEFTETVAGLYFMSPVTRAAIGYPGQEASPARAEMVDFEEVLLPVFEINRHPRVADEDGPQLPT